MAETPTSPGIALWAAERYNQFSGHQNLGPLSTEYGFLPAPGCNAALPASHAEWDHVAAALPELHRGLTVRTVIDRMPVLPADRSALPDEALQRSAVVLGLLAHAYFHLSPTRPAPPPSAIAAPWAEVCRRLGRSGPYLSYVDLVVCNWRLIDPTAADPMRVHNLRMLVPTVDNEEEHIFHLTQTEILARTAPAVGAIVRIDDAIRQDDPDGVAEALGTITTALREATRWSLPSINPRPDSRNYVDPVVWARTVAPFAVPIAPGALGPSGTAAPLFNLLDSLFQRSSQRSQLGREILGHRAAYPLNWRRFLTAVDGIALGAYVERTGHPLLRDAVGAAFQAYAGEHGFLSRHRRKVFGYLEIAFKVGRGVTIGGFAGALQDRTWTQVDHELEKSQRERGAESATSARAVPPSLPAGATEPTYPLSELVLHNDDEHGYWISIDDTIYDVSGFLRRHPGGPMVLQGYAGRDATQAYHRLHSTSTAAAVALRRCRIGTLTPGPTATGSTVTGLTTSTATCDPRSAARLFGTWANLLSLVVEMQNALRQDYGLHRGVGQSRQPEDPRSPYLLERRVDTFERFITSYVRPIGDAVADVVWPMIVAAGGSAVDAAPGLRPTMRRLWSSSAATATTALPDKLRDRLTAAAAGGPSDAFGTPTGEAERQQAEFRRIDALCERLAADCAAYLCDLKRLLRDGMLLLEQAHPAGPTGNLDGVIDPGTCAVLAVVAGRIPGQLTRWLERVAAALT